MTTLAGQTVVAGRVPVERIATQPEFNDSSTFTTVETIVSTLVAPLVNGRTYRIMWYGKGNSSVGTDSANWRIREDNAAGTELQLERVDVAGSTSSGRKVMLIAEYTAVATGNKTFVVTGVRAAGTGNNFNDASSTNPSFFYADYLRGI